MILAYQGAVLVTVGGLKHEPLVINTRTGRILPPSDIARADNITDAEGLAIYAGLINAHDHLELNHFPRTRPRARYTNARDWAADVSRLLDEDPFKTSRAYPLTDQCLIGGFKNLFSGVTTVAHHNPLHPPLKKRAFPVTVLGRYGWAHSLYLSSPLEIQAAHRKKGLFMIHLAERTDPNTELDDLAQLGALTDKTLLIHGVGLSAPDQKQAIGGCRGLVWCPSTNLYLLGQTAEVRDWSAAGKLALGSDSRLTADGDLLDELRAAYQAGQIDALALYRAATSDAAKLLGYTDRGDIAPTMRADLFALPLRDDPYLGLIRAKRSDIRWIMRGGRIIWRQAGQNPNCVLDGVPYRMAEALLKRGKVCQIAYDGLQIRPQP